MTTTSATTLSIPDRPSPSFLPPATARDWTEDAPHENGNYQNLCCGCHQTFIGHKRRVVCKVCATNDEADAKRRGQWLHDHGAPADWVIYTVAEVNALVSRFAITHAQMLEERDLRRSLAEAVRRINAAIPRGAVPGAHYALKDAMEIVAESEQRDSRPVAAA